MTAGLGGFAVTGKPSGRAAAARPAGRRRDPWDVLASRISGQVMRPGDPGFAAVARPYNLRSASITPAGIARCVSANDVAQSIIWAQQYGYPLVARSGGHSAGGYSVTQGLMITTRQINQTRFDARTGIATVGGGTLNQGVYDALSANNATITHGRCPTVGAAGFLLGGGVGFNIRRLGVASDALVASQIVTADGEILTLSDSQNPDLFWACRGGGGGNFGISTSFSVQTTPVPGSVTVSRLTWDAGADQVMPALAGALQESPVSLGSWTTVDAVTPQQRAAGKDVSLYFEGQLIGTPSQLRQILAPAYAEGKPSEATIREMGYWQAQEDFFADVEEPTDFQNRGLYFRGPLGEKAIATLLYWMRRWPGTSIYARTSFLQTGGQANALPATATAFVHRDNDWYLLWYLKWSSQDSARTVSENLAWLSAFYDAMAPYALPETYQNFQDPSLKDYLSQYYGRNVPRLERIKAAVDPRQIFDFPQAIPPA